jgi:hypothetical protein
MTALVLTAALFVVAVACHTPRDAAGQPLTRGQRSFFGDARSMLGF